jgi:hypothetical protein
MIDDPTIAPWTKITWKQIQKRLKEDIQEIWIEYYNSTI